MTPLLAFAAALALTALCVAVGERLLAVLRVPVAGSVRLAVAFTAGSWALGVAVLAVGLAGWLRPAVLVAVCAGLALAGSWRWRKLRWQGMLAAAPAMVLLLPVALAPPFFYDALVYHLALPWQALLEGAWRAHPESLYATAPALAQFVSAVPLALGLERAPAVLHLLSFGVAAAAVWGLARTAGAPRWAASLAAFSLLLLPAIAAVPALPGASGWAIAAVASGLAVALAAPPRPGAVLLAGFLAGAGCAARLQVLPLALAVAALAALRGRSRARAAGLAAAGLVVGSLPWWLKNLVLLGSPLAPIGWQVGGAAALWKDSVNVLHGAAGVGAAAATVGRVLTGHLSYLGPLALAGVLALAARRSPRVRLLALAVAAGFAGWVAVGVVPRYLVATMALALALAASAARRGAGRLGGGAVLVTVAALGLVFSFGEVRRLGDLHLVTDPPARVRRAWVPNDPFPAFAACAALPRGRAGLFVGEPRGFGFPRDFEAPSTYDASPLRPVLETAPSAAAVRAWLRGRGFTHLLVNRGELGSLAPGYPVAPWRSEAGRVRWGAFLATLGAPVVDRGGVAVYRVGG